MNVNEELDVARFTGDVFSEAFGWLRDTWGRIAPEDDVARDHINQAVKAFNELAAALPNDPRLRELAHAVAGLITAVRSTLTPDLITAAESKLQSQKAKLGVQKRAKEGRPWHADAEKTAQAACEKQTALMKKTGLKPSGLSQDKIVEAIVAGWNPKNGQIPSHVTLKKFVSSLQKAGKLPRKTKKNNNVDA
jgi:hypothetical protein